MIEECQRLGLRIPHDVAVIGMEDDPTLCEFCRPTLSSVSRDSWQLGFETATVLGRLMDGQEVPEEVVVPPEGIAARQSTDTVAVDDPDVAAAVHFVHDHLNECFHVGRVLQAVSISPATREPIRPPARLHPARLSVPASRRTREAVALRAGPGQAAQRGHRLRIP